MQLIFSSVGFEKKTLTKRLTDRELFQVSMELKRSTRTFKGVTITDSRKRNEAGNITFNPKLHGVSPNIVGGIEGMLKIFWAIK